MPVKRLTDMQWQCCLKTAEQLAQDNENHERTLFIITALYMFYLRISELTASNRWIPQMKHFYQDSNQNWWFKTLGKGNKTREIAVSDDMLASLKRYRESMGMTALPSPSDSRPLSSKEKGKGAIASTRHIRKLVQYCFDKTVAQLRKDKLVNEANDTIVHWDVAGADGFNTNTYQIIHNVIDNTQNGSIIILHMNGAPTAPMTAEALPEIISTLNKRGFEFVKVSTILGMPPEPIAP